MPVPALVPAETALWSPANLRRCYPGQMVRTTLLLAVLAASALPQPVAPRALKPQPQPVAPRALEPQPPRVREVAPDTFLVEGAMLAERGPDGNTIVLVGPAGLVVVDTGRHAWHSDGILAFAAARRLPIVAIINTHWHLDHSSGNGRVKAAHPAARIYTTTAVSQATGPGGFLARSLAAAIESPVDASTPAVRREEREIFIATMKAANALGPDVAVDRSGPMAIAGRRLDVRVTKDAVTAADLWVFDEQTGVAVLGDLVTLPAPFFETACPAQWEAALDDVWATPFTLAVPGHGAPMTRAQFDAYRQAFGAFRACVGSDMAPKECAAGWTHDVRAFVTTKAERREATDYAAYYVDFLRKNGGASPDCAAK